MNSILIIFNKYPNLFIAFSKKQDDNLRMTGQADELITQNRENFLKSINIGSSRIVSPLLAHGNQVMKVDGKDAGKIIPNTDGLITNSTQVFLTITVADCLPIFLFDEEKKVIALVHAGWRGLQKGIVDNAVSQFIKDFGSDPKNIIAGIGPCICARHYEVKEDVSSEFKDYPQAISNTDGRISLDLKQIARQKLIKLGLKQENIEISSECTYELENKYFSFRRDKPAEVQAMLAVFGIIN